MASKSFKNQSDPTVELLKDLLIVELAKAGVPQLEIRRILGCNIHRVNKIAKVLKKAKDRMSE